MPRTGPSILNMSQTSSTKQENVPPAMAGKMAFEFTRGATTVSMEERIITANPNRYVPASTYSSKPSDVQTHGGTLETQPVSYTSALNSRSRDVNGTRLSSSASHSGGALPGTELFPDPVLRHAPSGAGPDASRRPAPKATRLLR